MPHAKGLEFVLVKTFPSLPWGWTSITSLKVSATGP